MYHIPKFFFIHKRNKHMSSRGKRTTGPKLQRLLATKNFDYDPSTSSPSSPSPARRAHSLDTPLHNKSFRIQGIEGEFEIICKTLGLSEPEDFGISLADWEARKKKKAPRSLSDNTALVAELSHRFEDSVRVSVPKIEDSVSAVADCSDIRANNDDDDDDISVFIRVGMGGGGGIRGVRPPFLAPPPSMSLPPDCCAGSTWDIVSSFAPESCDNNGNRLRVSYSSDEDNDEVVREEVRNRNRGILASTSNSAAFLSESCSFTTNDDDSSSTTTEPMSNISPNGRFRRIVTSWEKGDLLGRGSFGSVYEGIADGGFFMAIKEVSLLDQGDMGRESIYQLEQEIALLSQFEHENIVQYYGTDKDDAHLYIFLELVTKGSLLNLYQKYHLRDSQVSSYTRQILHGLKYLHERNVVHRDIKCANILVDASGFVKLADFGLAKATTLNDVKSCKGTAFWMAPEVVRGRSQGYGLPADIWSLGCTVLEMLTHQIPYSPLECMQAVYRIGKGEPPPVPDSLSVDAQDFILRCLKVDPNDRPTATQLLDHPFVRRPLSATSGSSSPYHSIGRG